MTQSRFFQVSLSFPVVIWLVLLVSYSFAPGDPNSLLQSNIRDGYRIMVPYVIFAAGVWRLAAGKPYRALMLMTFFIPIFWGVFFTLFYMAAALIKGHAVDKWYVLCIMAFWAMLAAYIFEIIPYLILHYFKNDFSPELEGQSAPMSVEQNASAS